MGVEWAYFYPETPHFHLVLMTLIAILVEITNVIDVQEVVLLTEKTLALTCTL